MTTDRLGYIDALRGFAILGVILTHAASLADLQGHASALAVGAGNGVLLFFVVSACTIFMTLTKAVDREQAPFRNFFIKRMMRLLPVYWCGIVLYTTVYGLGSRGWRDGPELWHYPLHFTLTNDLHPAVTSSVVPGGWSISCEAIFYLTCPLWFWLVKSWKSAVVLVVASIVLGPVMVRVAQIAVGDAFSNIDPGVLNQYWYRSFPSQLGTFSFGILLYFLTKERPAFTRVLERPVVNALVLTLAVTCLTAQAIKGLPIVPRQYVWGAGFMMVALTLSYQPWQPIVNPIIQFIGKISYSAYLVHFLVLKQTYDVLGLEGYGGATGTAILMLVCTPLTLMLAYLGFRFVEQPTTHLAKRWIGLLEARGMQTSEKDELRTAP